MFIATLIVAVSIQADVPRLVNIQGVLNNTDGSPVADGDYAVIFRIYDAETGGNEVWSEAVASLAVENGIFNALLGSINPIPPEAFSAPDRWLSIQVGSDAEMAPRSRISSVAYALRAAKADTADVALTGDVWSYNDSAVYLENGKVGIGTTEPRGTLHVHNDTTQASISISGASDNGLTYSALYLNGLEMDAHINSWVLAHKKRTGSSLEDGLAIGNWVDDAHYVRMLIKKNGAVGINALDPQYTLDVGGCIGLSGPDLCMHAGGDRGDGGRALVHWLNDQLCLNFEGDFSGGTRVMGSGLQVDGRVTTSVLEITGGADLAEPFPVSSESEIEPGMAVVIDAQHPGHVKVSSKPYDRCIAGIISGAGGVNAGISLVQDEIMEAGQNVALTGRVFAKATNANGKIQPGDLLTTSSIPGHLMKATDSDLCQNATVGKAMSTVDEVNGLVLVLVNLQ